MDASLLATRIRIPPAGQHVIARERLSGLLERAVPDSRLVLVSAPAGYGKTTLLAEWARESRYRVVWLTAEMDDGDRERFFRALLAAWEQVEPAVRDSPFGLLVGSAEADPEAVLAAFIALAGQQSDHLAFVIDDAHLLTDQAIWHALTRLIDHLPAMAHLVLAGRGEPALPLARYRARRELREFGVHDLRFSQDEAGLLLNRLLDRELFPDDIAALHHRLEGWAAGLQLAGLARQHDAAGTGPPVLNGRHRFIAGYLREEVLAPLPPDTVRFLVQTSILDRFCASLCDAVTGEPGGRAVIESLERGGLFLVPLDDERVWFRYHTLFAHVLRDELRQRFPDEIPDLHRRAARWYREQDLPEFALRHAMAADDLGLAVPLAETVFEVKLLGAEYGSLRRWLDALPARWMVECPMLGLFQAGLLLSTGAIEAGIDRIDDVERALDHASYGDRQWNEARVTALRCLVACFTNDLAEAEKYAGLAMARLPSRDHMLRSAIHHALGDAYRRHGRWADARAHYIHALEMVHEPAYHIRSVHVLGALADLALEQGQLRQSAHYWKRALALIETRATLGALPLPVTGWIFIRYAGLLYEWNALDDMRWHLEQGIERAELGGDVRAIIAGYLFRARLRLTNGEIEQAGEDLERARPLVEATAFPESTALFERRQIELWLAQGMTAHALAHAEQRMASPGTIEETPAHLAATRVLVLRGDHSAREHALAALAPLLSGAQSAGQTGAAIEAFALQAIAHDRNGQQDTALVDLEQAMRLAQPEGYARLFADLGLPMARLLKRAGERGVTPAYVQHLLAAYTDAAAPGERQALPEPLSARETAVLQLAVAGLTNREIAGTLSISAETVKKHLSSIYGKLGVRSRTEAAARARELDLLDDGASPGQPRIAS